MNKTTINVANVEVLKCIPRIKGGDSCEISTTSKGVKLFTVSLKSTRFNKEHGIEEVKIKQVKSEIELDKGSHLVKFRTYTAGKMSGSFASVTSDYTITRKLHADTPVSEVMSQHATEFTTDDIPF